MHMNARKKACRKDAVSSTMAASHATADGRHQRQLLGARADDSDCDIRQGPGGRQPAGIPFLLIAWVGDLV